MDQRRGRIRPHRIEAAGDGTSIIHDEEHGAFHIRTERLDPPRYAAFRWIGRGTRRVPEPDRVLGRGGAADGVTLRVVESGLENVPESEREAYLRDNTQGWETELAAARTRGRARGVRVIRGTAGRGLRRPRRPHPGSGCSRSWPRASGSAADLATLLDITRQAVEKQLGVLEEAGPWSTGAPGPAGRFAVRPRPWPTRRPGFGTGRAPGTAGWPW